MGFGKLAKLAQKLEISRSRKHEEDEEDTEEEESEEEDDDDDELEMHPTPPFVLRADAILRYGEEDAQVAVVTGRHPYHLIMIGGQGEGLMWSHHTRQLAEGLENAGWSMVQTLLRSSHTGWGLASLATDAEDLGLLARYLRSALGSQGIALLGHSTGCQDIVRFLGAHGRGAAGMPPVVAAILEAPASDREFLATDDDTPGRLKEARRMVKRGDAEEILYRDHDYDGAAVTARRFLALAGGRGDTRHGGDDDYFSTDFSDAELAERLAPLRGTPTLFLLAGEDEYVPSKRALRAFAPRLAAASGGATVIVPGANHEFHGHEGVATGHIMSFLLRLQRPPPAGGCVPMGPPAGYARV